jgi:uncharacterized cofD-like protein
MLVVDRKLLYPRADHIVLLSGGTGSLSITDKLLDTTPNVTAITTITDNGGHTGEVRSELGVLGGGDATQQMTVRVRDAEIRKVLEHRFEENGQRAINNFLAAAEKELGSHSAGIKSLERLFAAHYVGRVVPISDDRHIHLKVHFQDGSSVIGEQHLDDLPPEQYNSIETISYVRELRKGKQVEGYAPHTPVALDEALEAIRNCDAWIKPPTSVAGSWWGVAEVPDTYPALKESRGAQIGFVNACEKLDWDGAKHLQIIVEKVGRKFDEVFINIPPHEMPQPYLAVGMRYVRPYDPSDADYQRALEACKEYALKVTPLAMTKVYQIAGKPTIRHDGALVAPQIFRAIDEHKARQPEPFISLPSPKVPLRVAIN